MELLLPWLPGLFLLLGLLFGSLANVIIYRLPLMMGIDNDSDDAGVNLWWPPSHCPVCKSAIKPWDNIPVLSWLLLRGKCRQCGTAIPAIYPLSELAMGLVWCALAYFGAPLSPVILLAWAILFLLLYIAAVIDFKHLILPDTLVFSVLWGGVLLSVSGYSFIRPKDAVYGVVLAWLLLWCVMKLWCALCKYEGLGNGDVKLFAAAGAWLGWQHLPELLLCSALLGLLCYAAIYVITRRHGETRPVYIPFGPAIALTAFMLVMSRG